MFNSKVFNIVELQREAKLQVYKFGEPDMELIAYIDSLIKSLSEKEMKALIEMRKREVEF